MCPLAPGSCLSNILIEPQALVSWNCLPLSEHFTFGKASRLLGVHFPFPEDLFTSFLSDELLAIKHVSATTSAGKPCLTVSVWVDLYACTVLATLGYNCLFTMREGRDGLPLPPTPRAPDATEVLAWNKGLIIAYWENEMFARARFWRALYITLRSCILQT